MLKPSDIRPEVDSVLRGVDSDRRGRPFLTAYQILERLSTDVKNRLLLERGRPGRHADTYYSAASAVSDAAEMIPDIEISHLDTSHLNVTINDNLVIEAGRKNVGLYRVKG